MVDVGHGPHHLDREGEHRDRGYQAHQVVRGEHQPAPVALHPEYSENRTDHSWMHRINIYRTYKCEKLIGLVLVIWNSDSVAAAAASLKAAAHFRQQLVTATNNEVRPNEKQLNRQFLGQHIFSSQLLPCCLVVFHGLTNKATRQPDIKFLLGLLVLS